MISWRSAGVASVVTLSGCTGNLSALDPAGPSARSIAFLWHIMAWSTLAILVFMVLLATYACVRKPRPHERPSTSVFLLGGGVLFPSAVLLALLIYGLQTGDAQTPQADDENAYRIHVRAHQWWWEIIHPDAPNGPVTARNEIYAPAGQPLHISVSTNDVIHSFWIPRLGGKIDAIPGRVNTIRLVADAPGVYHGVCAEFCGTGHSAMPLQLFALEPAELKVALRSLESASVSPVSGSPEEQTHHMNAIQGVAND